MQDKIKRVAQFLFDNAEFIESQLHKTDFFRALNIAFNSFDPESEDVKLQFYDQRTTHYNLKDSFITIEGFRDICAEMDRVTGETKPPEPVEIRSEL